MRVLGLDTGSQICGYGIIETEPLGYVECGVFKARGTKWQRIGVLGQDLRALLAEHKWGLDDLCGFESAFVPRGRFMGVEALAEARGALAMVCMDAGLSIQTVAPATVKKAVTGNGRATKEQVATHVQKLFGLSKRPANDAADALGVALALANGAGR